MTSLDTLIARIDAYADKAGISKTTASRRVFNDGKRLKELRNGSRLWPETLQKAEECLAVLEKTLTGQEAA